MRLAYEAPCPGTRKCRVILDAPHLANPQRAAWLDRFHYTDMDEGENPMGENLNYLELTVYQPP